MTSATPSDLRSPVHETPEDKGRVPEEGLALCLSGGGYRAMVFHVGVLWRLNEVGLLPKLDRISTVSGGSITAGVLGTKWSQLEFVDGVARKFVDIFVDPVRRMAGTGIDMCDAGLRSHLAGEVSNLEATALPYPKQPLG